MLVGTVNLKLPLLNKYVKNIKTATYETHVGIVNGATYKDGKSVAYIGYLNEYGGHNPPRPFLKRTQEEQTDKWLKIYAGKLKNNVSVDTIKEAHKTIGVAAKGDVKKTISKWNPSDPRANKPATIRRKARRGRSGKNLEAINPNVVLIDSGTMIRNIGYEVVKK